MNDLIGAKILVCKLIQIFLTAGPSSNEADAVTYVSQENPETSTAGTDSEFSNNQIRPLSIEQDVVTGTVDQTDES